MPKFIIERNIPGAGQAGADRKGGLVRSPHDRVAEPHKIRFWISKDDSTGRQYSHRIVILRVCDFIDFSCEVIDL